MTGRRVTTVLAAVAAGGLLWAASGLAYVGIGVTAAALAVCRIAAGPPRRSGSR